MEWSQQFMLQQGVLNVVEQFMVPKRTACSGVARDVVAQHWWIGSLQSRLANATVKGETLAITSCGKENVWLARLHVCFCI